MKDFKLVILMGLPGSGKTTFAKSLYDAKVIDIDAMLRRKFRTQEKPKKLIEVFDASNYSYTTIKSSHKYFVLDGPFFSNNDVIDFITAIWECCATYKREFPFTGIEIHHWNEDRENCQRNDAKRRTESSYLTIQLANYEAVDKKRIKALFKVPVTVVEHKVYIKPDWQLYFEDKINFEGEYLCSAEWSTGGEYGSCWSDELTSFGGDTPLEFEAFDDLLEQIYPNITFLQYKKLRAACISSDTSTSYDYYGGHANYAFWRCHLPTLYQKLKELSLINRDEE